jgi:ribosome hibernation promoting factor
MSLRIAGKNFDIGQALRSRIDETVTGTVQKYFDRGYSGLVTLSKVGHLFETDVAVHLDSGVVLEAHAENPDAHLSFDQAAEKLAKQLRRYKRRLKDH